MIGIPGRSKYNKRDIQKLEAIRRVRLWKKFCRRSKSDQNEIQEFPPDETYSIAFYTPYRIFFRIYLNDRQPGRERPNLFFPVFHVEQFARFGNGVDHSSKLGACTRSKLVESPFADRFSGRCQHHLASRFCLLVQVRSQWIIRSDTQHCFNAFDDFRIARLTRKDQFDQRLRCSSCIKFSCGHCHFRQEKFAQFRFEKMDTCRCGIVPFFRTQSDTAYWNSSAFTDRPGVRSHHSLYIAFSRYRKHHCRTDRENNPAY